MSVTRNLLDSLKATSGGLSDYRVAKIIGVSQSTMTKYNKDDLPLSAEKVILICKHLETDPYPWLLRMRIERAKCDAEKEVWESALTRMAA